MDMTKVQAKWDEVHAWTGVHPTITWCVLCFVVGFLLAKCTG